MFNCYDLLLQLQLPIYVIHYFSVCFTVLANMISQELIVIIIYKTKGVALRGKLIIILDCYIGYCMDSIIRKILHTSKFQLIWALLMRLYSFIENKVNGTIIKIKNDNVKTNSFHKRLLEYMSCYFITNKMLAKL